MARRSPCCGLRFWGEPDVEPLDRRQPDGQSLRGSSAKLLRCQKGAPAEATAIASRLGGPGRQTHMGAAPEGLRHLNPLDRGAGRGISRQHEHPVEGPATCEVADPTAGCSVCACGYGYPDHVATSWFVGVSGRPTDPHHKVVGPSGPSRLPSRSTGSLAFSIYVRRHHTAEVGPEETLGATCRSHCSQRPLTALHDLAGTRCKASCSPHQATTNHPRRSSQRFPAEVICHLDLLAASFADPLPHTVRRRGQGPAGSESAGRRTGPGAAVPSSASWSRGGDKWG